jgi:hypothetical protein
MRVSTACGAGTGLWPGSVAQVVYRGATYYEIERWTGRTTKPAPLEARKHTANVHESLRDIREIIARLVEKRDARRDSFVEVIKKAMGETLAPDAEEALKLLQKHGVTKALAKEATEIAQAKGAFTIFAVVDALTRLSSRLTYTGDRAAIDEKASSLLALAA